MGPAPEASAMYLDDTLHGPYKLYNTKHNIIISGQFSNGKKSGIWTVFNNQFVKIMEIGYKDGLIDGYHRTWYDSGPFEGKMKMECVFNKGVINGQYRTFGNPAFNAMFDNGAILSVNAVDLDGKPILDHKTLRDELEKLSEGDIENVKYFEEIVDYSLSNAY